MICLRTGHEVSGSDVGSVEVAADELNGYLVNINKNNSDENKKASFFGELAKRTKDIPAGVSEVRPNLGL
jgi:hypothetical protein